MGDVPPELAGHPDRIRWNQRYASAPEADFAARPLAQRALSLAPAGPVLELACGPSGSALLAAASGRRVTAVDVSDAALHALAAEARRRDLEPLITLVQADLASWRGERQGYALVMCTGYWDRAAFRAGADAVGPAGIIAWEAFTTQVRQARPSFPLSWCMRDGEPAGLLPDGLAVLDCHDDGTRRQFIARRMVAGSVHADS
jgi:SAM-dependent methyltransferase